jgi:hypothetical protein
MPDTPNKALCPLIEKLKALRDKATPTPWVRSKHGSQIITADSMTSITETNVPRGLNRTATEEQREQHLINLDLIVAAVNAIDKLESWLHSSQMKGKI